MKYSINYKHVLLDNGCDNYLNLLNQKTSLTNHCFYAGENFGGLYLTSVTGVPFPHSHFNECSLTLMFLFLFLFYCITCMRVTNILVHTSFSTHIGISVGDI